MNNPFPNISIKKILFLHGFTSGGNCDIAHTLIDALQGEVEVVSPDLPLHPTDALEFVRHLCVTEKPDLIVGSSCGAFYAQQVVRTEGIPALLINPFFMMSEFLEPRIGTHAYKCKRKDGNQSLKITSALIEEFKQMEQHQFDLYDDFNKNRIWGLFGTQDHLAHFKTKFSEYYSTIRNFDGGHTIEPQNVCSVLVPMIKEMLATVHPLHERYFRHFKGNLYRMWQIALDSETMERKVVYQALYGEHGYWCRPEQMFFEVIERDGKRMPRFKEIVATEIQKCAIPDRNNKLLEDLLVLWNASVHTTHSFLSEEAIESLRPYVLKGLKGVTHLYVTYRGEKPIAFMGIANEKIEMLFVSPYHLRQGLGKQLVELALKNHQVIYVDVNEQNVQAKAFYEHLNYEIYGRSETDDQGNPYPILEMEQKNISFYTERLFIRPLQIKDVEVLHSFMKRIEVMYAWEHGFAQKEVREWINKQIIGVR